jgi:hypothetical protein
MQIAAVDWTDFIKHRVTEVITNECAWKQGASNL